RAPLLRRIEHPRSGGRAGHLGCHRRSRVGRRADVAPTRARDVTTPTDRPRSMGAPPPMTPARWRAVDAILQAALACEPERRDAVVAVACGDDEALRREVDSLLAA